MRQGWAIVLVAVFVFTGCPTDVKKLRTGDEDANDPVNSIGNFNISFAYRDIDPDTTNRQVQIQANHLLAEAKLEPICGATGDDCTCEFFNSSSSTTAVAASSVTLSPITNVLACTIPTSVADADLDDYVYVKVRTTDGLKNSGLVAISNSLTAEQILGDLDTDQIRKIFDYSCTRTFIEGSGVAGSAISCNLTPDLGFLSADYKFYLYQGFPSDDGDNDDLDNFDDHPDEPELYPTYCNRAGDAQFTCGTQSATPVFGLMKEAVGFFQTSVFLTSRPDGGSAASSLFGFAALADSNGLCPPGLFAIRAWRADPPSITKDYLGNSNPPSNFLNFSGTLNSIIVTDASAAPADFAISRSPNSPGATGDCVVADNDCSGATFAGVSVVETVSYSAQSPIICAISEEVLRNL